MRSHRRGSEWKGLWGWMGVLLTLMVILVVVASVRVLKSLLSGG